MHKPEVSPLPVASIGSDNRISYLRILCAFFLYVMDAVIDTIVAIAAAFLSAGFFAHDDGY